MDIYPLYESTWPGLPDRIRMAGQLGWNWDAVTTPFTVLLDGAVGSHTGVLEYDLWIEGRRISVAGLHAVCTHPDHRGKGLARQTLNAALAYVDGKGLPAVLGTDKPAVYEPHGFRVVDERRWRLGATGAQRSATTSVTPDLLERLHATRTPLSNRRGTLAPSWMFGICAVLETGSLEALHYSSEHDAIVVWEREEDGTIAVYDVVASQMPDLSALLDLLPEAPAVVLAFHPDRFPRALETGTAIAAPADDLWMVRGLDVADGIGQMPLLSRH